jgi:hypothetical protein
MREEVWAANTPEEVCGGIVERTKILVSPSFDIVMRDPKNEKIDMTTA